MTASTAAREDAWRRLLSGPPPPWLGGPFAAAPDNLAQSVLPGWNFGTIVNLTDQNSAAPQTEVAILQKQSYGRQLGQIIDALQVLITERADAGKGPDPALTKFSEMRDEIEEIKSSGLADRIERMCTDLAALRDEDGQEFQRLRARILEAL